MFNSHHGSKLKERNAGMSFINLSEPQRRMQRGLLPNDWRGSPCRDGGRLNATPLTPGLYSRLYFHLILGEPWHVVGLYQAFLFSSVKCRKLYPHLSIILRMRRQRYLSEESRPLEGTQALCSVLTLRTICNRRLTIVFV